MLLGFVQLVVLALFYGNFGLPGAQKIPVAFVEAWVKSKPEEVVRNLSPFPCQALLPSIRTRGARWGCLQQELAGTSLFVHLLWTPSVVPCLSLSLPWGTLRFPSELMEAAEDVESKAFVWQWLKNNSFYGNTVITGTLPINVAIENLPVKITSSTKVTSSTVGMAIRYMHTILFRQHQPFS